MKRPYNNTEIIMASFIFPKGNRYDSKKAFSESLFVDDTMFSQQEIMTIFKEYFNVILENKENIELTAESKKTYKSQKNNVTKEQAIDFLNKLCVFLQEKTSKVQEDFEDDIKKLWNENTNEQTIVTVVESWPKTLQQELEGNVAIELNRLIDESITKTTKEFPNISRTKLDTMKKNLSKNHRKK